MSIRPATSSISALGHSSIGDSGGAIVVVSIRPARSSILTLGLSSTGDSGGVIAAVPMVVNGNGSGDFGHAPGIVDISGVGGGVSNIAEVSRVKGVTGDSGHAPGIDRPLPRDFGGVIGLTDR